MSVDYSYYKHRRANRPFTVKISRNSQVHFLRAIINFDGQQQGAVAWKQDRVETKATKTQSFVSLLYTKFSRFSYAAISL